jgi:hypothetical protein
MADPDSNPPSKHVGRGLVGLDIDPSKMSPEALEIYRDYQAVASDDAPGDKEAQLRELEHKLRGQLTAEKYAREVDNLKKKP